LPYRVEQWRDRIALTPERLTALEQNTMLAFIEMLAREGGPVVEVRKDSKKREVRGGDSRKAG
jgi:hypothetical protein